MQRLANNTTINTLVYSHYIVTITHTSVYHNLLKLLHGYIAYAHMHAHTHTRTHRLIVLPSWDLSLHYLMPVVSTVPLHWGVSHINSPILSNRQIIQKSRLLSVHWIFWWVQLEMVPWDKKMKSSWIFIISFIDFVELISFLMLIKNACIYM